MELNESYRRNSGPRDLDTNKLVPYYGVTYVFGSFTDNGDFELNKSLDDRLDRPRGILGYPVNDMVGRRVKTSAMYVRMFRYRYYNNDTLIVSQYNDTKLKKDYDKLISYFINDPEFIEVLNTLNTRIDSDEPTAFGKIWELTRQISRIDRSLQWEQVFTAILGYDAIYDDRGLGKIVRKRTVVLFVFDTDPISTMEVIEILKDKPEQNSHIASKVARFNDRSDISNARRRVKK